MNAVRKEISFAAERKDALLIGAIAERASIMARKHGFEYPFMDADMDITACHVNGCPLKLAELLKADDANFSHDVFGIRRHLNRETRQLEDCFVPRYYARTK